MSSGESHKGAIRNFIQRTLGCEPTEHFDPGSQIASRIVYLKRYLKKNKLKALVLGISGGVDSTVAGKLAQRAVDELCSEGYPAKFVAVRLPFNVQADEVDAQGAIGFIAPSVVHEINIGAAVNCINQEVIESAGELGTSPEAQDFHKGNVKARMRMLVQYQLAAMYGGAVLGTDHNAENLMGFYTKGGDGFCDLLVLNGLNKRQVRMLARELGASESLWSKEATADLEEGRPGISDEEALGVTYDEIDDYLEGKDISEESEGLIIDQFLKTDHKRSGPAEFVEK